MNEEGNESLMVKAFSNLCTIAIVESATDLSSSAQDTERALCADKPSPDIRPYDDKLYSRVSGVKRSRGGVE